MRRKKTSRDDESDHLDTRSTNPRFSHHFLPPLVTFRKPLERWVKRFLPNHVHKAESRTEYSLPPELIKSGAADESLPKVFFTTKKKDPTPLLKSLSHEFFKRASFFIITDPDAEEPTMHLDDEEFTGSLKERSEIVDFISARTLDAWEDQYYYVEQIDEEFAKFGTALEVKSFPPPQTHYWLVAVVPSVSVDETGFNPHPLERTSSGSSVESQLPGFDEIAKACVGAMRAGVYVNPDTVKPYVRLFTCLDTDDPDNPCSNKAKGYKSVVDAYDALVEALPEKVVPILGDNAGVSLFLGKNVYIDPNRVALLVFSQKSYPPAFLKNVAILTEGIVDVGMISNPRDDVLESFNLQGLPDIITVYDTPMNMRPADAKEGTLLGQAVYNKDDGFSFEAVMRYVLTVLNQVGLEGGDEIQMRMVEGLKAKDVDSFRKKYESDASYEEAVKKEKEELADQFVGVMTKSVLKEVVKAQVRSFEE